MNNLELARKAALGPHDTFKVEDPNFGYKHTHEVTFRSNPFDTVINLTLYPNNTFKVSASACVPTDEFEAYTQAYARARNFVIAAGLKPKTAK